MGHEISPVHLEAIVALSRDLEANARLGEWRLAAELAERRNKMLEDFFTAGSRFVAILPMRDALTEIRDIDKRVQELAAKRKNAVAKELNDLSTGRKAADAYAAHGG